MMALVWDIGRLLWLTLLLLLIVWVPAALSTRSRRPSVTIVFEHFVVIVMLAVIAVSFLSPAHLLNPFTLLLAYACWPSCQWLVRHRGAVAADALEAARALALRGVIGFERVQPAGSLRRLVGLTAEARRAEFVAITQSVMTPIGLLMAVAIVIALGPTVAEAFANRRLPNPGAYGELLSAQQLLAGELGWVRPRVVSALTTAISVISSIAPAHLIRLLVPIAGAVALLSLITTVRVMSAAMLPATIATICAAVLWRGSDHVLASAPSAVFVLLALMFWSQTLHGARNNRWVAIGAAILVALLTPSLLVVIAAGVAMMMLTPVGAMMAAGTAWVVVSRITGEAAPLGWALTAAGIAHLAIANFRFARPPLRTGFAAAAAILGLAVVLPRTASASYVEYDASARATLEIANRFPKYRWMIVAPVEAWPLSYGRGWHMNLHEFVDEHTARVNFDDYRLPYEVDELLVFVETRPFMSFTAEPADVPFQMLIDPVYRYYRSPAGRSSLQHAAHRLCERLADQHRGASVYFDDGRLKIYRFTLR